MAGYDNVCTVQHLLWGLAAIWPSLDFCLAFTRFFSHHTDICSCIANSDTSLMPQYDNTKVTVFRHLEKQNELWNVFVTLWFLEFWRPYLEQETKTWSGLWGWCIGCDSVLIWGVQSFKNRTSFWTSWLGLSYEPLTNWIMSFMLYFLHFST